MIKNLINRLICLCRGHEWYEYKGKEFDIFKFKCRRCGESTYYLESVAKRDFEEGIEKGIWKKVE